VQETGKYDFDVVRWFSVMAVIYLVIGTLVGTYIASELAWPFLNFDIAEITFGRFCLPRPFTPFSVPVVFPCGAPKWPGSPSTAGT